MGHGRSGRLRSSSTSLVSGHGRDPDVFLDRFAGQLGEYSGKVDAGSSSLLPQRPDHPCGQQEGSEERREHEEGTAEDESGAVERRRRKENGGHDQRRRLPRMLSQDKRGRPGSFRTRHQSRARRPAQEARSLRASIEKKSRFEGKIQGFTRFTFIRLSDTTF